MNRKLIEVTAHLNQTHYNKCMSEVWCVTCVCTIVHRSYIPTSSLIFSFISIQSIYNTLIKINITIYTCIL